MRLNFIGDLDAIVHKIVQEGDCKTLQLKNERYGLGASYWPDQHQMVAETLVYNQKASAYWPDHFKSLNKEFKTPFFCAINHKPADVHQVKKKQTLKELYHSLMNHYQKPFVLVGQLEFEILELRYVKASLIAQPAPLIDCPDTSHYLEFETFSKIKGDIFGIVLNYDDPRLVYEGEDDLYFHAHLQIKDRVGHLMASSVVVSASLWCEPISEIVGM